MTAPDLFSCERARVKAQLMQSFGDALQPLLDAACTTEMSVRDAERHVWSALLEVGRQLLAAVFACMCRRQAQQALAARGLAPAEVAWRLDEDYQATLTTTLGRVSFPLFAFRHQGRLIVPGRQLFAMQRRVRVSALCWEWEAALAADHPFRKAAQALTFFTHGAVSLSNTTLQRHTGHIGRHLTQAWLYQTPPQLRERLLTQATRDKASGRPLLYLSTDAHALRRFVDETWDAPWKMINGIRLWCVDKNTGQTLHVGGEYTWGDCHEVVRRLRALQDSGHLPKDGQYGEGLRAQLVVLTDGQEWIAQQVLPLFPEAVAVLDPYHVLGQVADAARTAYGGEGPRVQRLVKQAACRLGLHEPRPKARARKGARRARHRRRRPVARGGGVELLALLRGKLRWLTKAGKQRWNTLLLYVERALDRLDYAAIRRRGIGLGSGAMESLHKSASQARLKRPGCRWTPQSSQELLNVRMLALSGRWDEFWAQPDLAQQLAEASTGADP